MFPAKSKQRVLTAFSFCYTGQACTPDILHSLEYYRELGYYFSFLFLSSLPPPRTLSSPEN